MSSFDQFTKRRVGRRYSSSAMMAASLAVAMGATISDAVADNFANVYYDSEADQLVVTIAYRGSNPDHKFSLRWGQCKEGPGAADNQIVVEVLDNEWKDVAVKNFKTTTRFGLDSLQCRPASVTLRTAPRFYYTVRVPARPASK